MKPLSEFFRNRSTADGHQSYCKPCWDTRSRGYNYKSSGKSYHRASHLVRNYGITLDEYNEMLARFDSKCWACRKPETAKHPKTGTVFALAVDHDHETGRVRGLLCFLCNKTIRATGDDRSRLMNLVNYLDGKFS